MVRFMGVDEQEVAQREEAADRALYAVDPELACALGYVAPRTRAGSTNNPTTRAVRALPHVLAQSLTRRPHDQLASLRGPRRMMGAGFSSIALTGSTFFGGYR